MYLTNISKSWIHSESDRVQCFFTRALFGNAPEIAGSNPQTLLDGKIHAWSEPEQASKKADFFPFKPLQ